MNPETIAVVTGANRGIGFEISRQLAGKGIHVILTSRDEAKGMAARRDLIGKGLDVRFHQLDVTDLESIQRLLDFIRQDYGRLDILVNNAGVLLDDGVSVLQVELDTVRTTMETNLYGPLLLCQALVPLMVRSDHGRIVNLSSGWGQLTDIEGCQPAYRMSKAALNALTGILAAELRGTNILVNSMCPGAVRTDMGRPDAPRSVEQGADTAVWLATLPNTGPSGGFFEDRKPIPW